MTDQQYTPTMYDIRDQFIEAWAGDFVFGKVDAAKYFDRALEAHNARIEAAAEQRGELRGKMEGFDEGIEHLSTYGYITIEVHDLALSENPYRADQIEVDDETH